MKVFPIKFPKKKGEKISYGIILLCLLILLIGTLFDLFLRYYNFSKSIRNLPFTLYSQDFPVFKSPIIDSSITAKAFVIMDIDSGTLLSSKNPNLLFSMASTTKIMTALVALDYFKPTDILTIRTENVEGVNVGFKKGEKIFFKDMLYAMLLSSGNDAALAIAENYPDGKEAFVEKMNEKAKAMKLTHTNFADSIGLEDSKDYTTAIDLARLAGLAMKNDQFSKIVATSEWEIADVSGVNTYVLRNLNQLLGLYGVNGVKTGYTTEAGQVLVTSKREGERNLIIVVMNSNDRFLDTRRLLYEISGNLTYLSIHP